MGVTPVAPHTEEEEFRFIERYLLFIGCNDPECDNDHNHANGWDTCAAGSNDLDELRKEVLRIPDGCWWHVLDLGQNPPRIIMRDTYAQAPRH